MESSHAKINDFTFKIIGNIFMEELRIKNICLVLSQHFSSTFGMIIKEVERDEIHYLLSIIVMFITT